jgi:outer membrane protein OmpA-like peptidoglycan-associated protein
VSSHARSHGESVASQPRSSKPTLRDPAAMPEGLHPTTIIHRAGCQAEALTPRAVLHLQRTLGNRAVQRLMRPAQPADLAAGSGTNEATRVDPDFPVVVGQFASATHAGHRLIAVQRKDAPPAGGPRPKAPSGPRGKDDQEQSWANPMKTLATEPALVATIYFRTKEFATDAQDEAVLRQLAKAYAPWAERNRGKPGAEQGLRGRIVGYADPRRSWEPNNAELSAKRAGTVYVRLVNFLMVETTLQGGHFDFERRAGEVAPLDPDAQKGAEEVSLGWQRRAEVYIAGKGSEAPPPQRDEPPPEPVVPEPEQHPDDFDRYIPQIQRCNTDYAKGLAARLLGYLFVSLIPKAFRYTGTIPILVPVPRVGTPPRARGIGTSKGAPVGGISYGNHGGVLPFQPKKPPWWDSRKSGYDADWKYLHRRRRPAETACEKMERTAMMLVRDMREVNKYIDLTVKDTNSAYLKFMNELRKDAPDVQKLREYAVPIEYLLFMWDATMDEAREVSAVADAVAAE